MSTSTLSEHDPQGVGVHRFLVVHALKVKGLAPEDDLAVATGLGPAELAPALEGLVAEELARLRSGRVPGYTLTKAGRAAHPELLAQHVTDAERAGVARAYDAFLPVNSRFKDVCTRWQMRPGPDGTPEPNAHGDAGYDTGVVEDLASVHKEVTDALIPAADASARFGRYPARFAAALERVRAGDVAAFAQPMSGSYHDVWMELHEDFLLTLGRERDAADGH